MSPKKLTASKSSPIKSERVSPVPDAHPIGSKRKAKVISSDSEPEVIRVRTSVKKSKVLPVDSDVEFTESTTPSKGTKKASARPSPGSVEYTHLPAVSIKARVDAALLSSDPSVSFGVVDIDPSTPKTTTASQKDKSPSRTTKNASVKRKIAKEKEINTSVAGSTSVTAESVEEKVTEISTVTAPETPSPSRARPRRTKTKTEKARLMEDVQDSTPVADNAKYGIGNTTPEADPPTSPLIIKDKTFVDSDDEHDPLPTTPTIKKFAVHKLLPKSSPLPIDVELDTGADHFNAQSDVEERDSDAVASPVEDSTSIAEAEPDDTLAVMRKELQDPNLENIYKSLPSIKRFCDVQPFSYNAGHDSPRVQFSTLCKVLPDTSINLVVQGLLFTRAGSFVNTSRISPHILTADSSQRMSFAGTTKHAIGIMLGVITECFLVAEGISGAPNASYPVHKVTIVPFAQEMRRDTSVWGEVLGFHVIAGATSPLGFSFFTKKKAARAQTHSAPSSPSKTSNLFFTVSSPLASSSRGEPAGSAFPSVRSFEDQVPIYDGRPNKGPGFMFTEKDFQHIKELPLYRNGKKDLPDNAVVAIGYGLNTYTSQLNGTAILSSNVLFVVLLGVPAASPVDT